VCLLCTVPLSICFIEELCRPTPTSMQALVEGDEISRAQFISKLQDMPAVANACDVIANAMKICLDMPASKLDTVRGAQHGFC
jgi:hypothetical protein